MKVIVSHDLDHITAWEHAWDGVLAKFLIRSSLQLMSGSIELGEYGSRIAELVRNQWHNLDELIEFDRRNRIPSTFFIGMSRGLGMSYNRNAARSWIARFRDAGFDVGVHGLAYEKAVGIREEFEAFRALSGLTSFGIRMHYLRSSENTSHLLEKTGYLFDSTSMGVTHPLISGRLVEFPLAIMDVRVMYARGGINPVPLAEAQETTKLIIAKALEADLPYLTVLFHDRYYSGCFKVWKQWYEWLIEYLQKKNIPFTSFRDAVAEFKNGVCNGHGVP